MSVLLQVSDPHFGTERPAVVEALLALGAELRPDLVVLSGDITQRARSSQFAAARRFMERLRAPAQLVVPGNHDIPLFDVFSRALDPYGGYARAFGNEVEGSWESDDMLVLALNTTRPYRHKHGELSQAQVDSVVRRVRACDARKLRIVVAHHPMAADEGADLNNLARGHVPAVRAWADAGADIVMGGHIHLPYVRDVRKRVPGLSRPLWVVQAGTAVSHRVRSPGGERNSVNVVRYAADDGSGACVVERWDHDARLARFARVASTRIALQR